MSQGGRILRALSRIGYPKVGEHEGDTLEWLFDCRSLVPFLEWFCDNIHASNAVSDEDLQRFDELHSSGAYILEKEQLEKTLSMLLTDDDECSTEALRNEVRTLGKEVELINQRLQKLVFQRNRLSLHQSSLGYKISKLNGVERHNKQKYKACLESSQADNKQINSSLEQLGRSVSDLTALYAENESSFPLTSGDQARSLLSQLQYDSYHFSEEKFTGELTAYTRKQFFEGIADMAGREEKSRYELLEISDPTSLLVRGENGEVNLSDCQELSRLQSVYASSESIRIQNTVNAKGLSAAVEAATEKAKNAAWESHPPDTDKIGAELLEVQKTLSQVKMEIRDLTERVLPELVQELGELQAISILKGDYNLKIARQDYFTSKQDQVITQLLLQRSRNEFLAMALEVEACKCRDTHRLFSTLNATLGEMVKSLEARTAIMEEHAHHSPRLTRATIDSRDHFMEHLYAVLENPAERAGEERRTKEMFLAYNQLIELSQKLAGQLESLNVSLSSSSCDQDDAWKQLENHLQLCMKTVYGESATTGGLPQLSPQHIFNGISQLDEVLLTLEHSIKDIIKDCEAKKKVLRSDSLKAMERELFVYFFTDPPRLKRAIAELSARVDAQIVSMKQ